MSALPDIAGASAPKQVLSLFDCVAIIVGIVIGVGIFRLPSIVAGIAGESWLILLVWTLGGVISFLGALCYAELSTAYPSTGGEYHFLTRAYGGTVGFMFAWARMTVIQPGSMALLAYVFGDYAGQLLPLGESGATIYAAVAVLALTGLNIAGIHQTRNVQKVLASIAVLGLIGVIAAGLSFTVAVPAATTATEPSVGFSSAMLGSSLIFVLLTYGGWNEAAYVSAEIRDGRRDIVRALLLSIGIITSIYVLVNFVYLKVLGVAGVANSKAVAADLMGAVFGAPGAVFITLLILVKALASINVTIFTGARTNYAMGRDFPLFGFLHQWSARGGAPVRALLFQCAVALGLIVLGSQKGVQTAVDYLSPVFWLFFLLTGVSLFVLRRRDANADRPFRTPLYPLTPALFCITCAYMLYSSVSYAATGALAGLGVLALGLPFLVLARRGAAATISTPPSIP
ncbi:MAG: amino acid permease [Rhodospirillaceae bacterium]|nr:amino acid permease [Rhodospirillaceae bacterium]